MKDTRTLLSTAAGVVDVSSPIVVGVVNATPDSFSDTGDRSTAGAIRTVHSHIAEGARVIEDGGGSNVTNRRAVSGAASAPIHVNP